MLPTDNCLPKDHKHAQKVLRGLGLGYEKIHACKNNCMLFYKEHETLDTCPICNESRFKMTSQNRTTKIPQKVMRYLPFKPRLQRLYMSTHTATNMRWHKEKRVDDDVMRHPADGEAWKEFDRTFPEFAADPRNVRSGLATDGFNPYGVLNQHYSTWPIFAFPYNLPPWKCMKKEYMMMTVLITEDPGRSIDVYLRPLVDELKDLWTNGVRTYDKSTGRMFTLRAAVMWTVNDFPAYAMVSGWSTKGYMACPVCKEDVTSGWHAGKVCYLGHRRWFPWDHEWREKDKEFDGNAERRLRPREWSGDEILEQLNRLDFAPFGKTVSRTRPSTHLNWTHKPMFFKLPYWSKLKLRHNLDVMHVEKNVFDTLVGTILDIEGKTKDTIKARLDLERMGIRRGLWMNRDSDKARRDLAFFSMKPNDKKEFLKFVSSVKFSDGYASNIARCVNVDGGKFTGLKSHECHVFMQRLLPVGIRHLLPEDVVKPIMLLSRFFSQLTIKTLRRTDMFQLRHDIVQVLCKFEMIFAPAFFTSMMHVMVHLPEEALLAGPVNYRWMYPIERLLGELKKSVRNRAKPKGSIIEAWVQYESLTFCGIPISPPSPHPPPLVPWPPCRRPRHRRLTAFTSCATAASLFSPPLPLLFSLRHYLIRRGRTMTTAPSSDPPAQSAFAATAPALMDHVVVGPGPSQAPASSASSVAQPASARRRHRPTDPIDTTSTDGTGASGSQPEEESENVEDRTLDFDELTDSNIMQSKEIEEEDYIVLPNTIFQNEETAPQETVPQMHQVDVNAPVEMNINQPEIHIDAQPQNQYNLQEEQEVRRSKRTRRSALSSDYVYLQESEQNDPCLEDPITLKQALTSSANEQWLQAMKSELNSMEKNKVWELVQLPQGCRPIGCKWIFKTKKDSKGLIDRYKARLVAKGFTQQAGVDYNETFSPVSTKDSFRVMMALVAHFNLYLHQMDVKTAFLNGDLYEEIYMQQPEGFIQEGREDQVCKLRKSIYGLKQASRQWYLKFDEVVRSHGFSESPVDECGDVPFSKGDKLSMEQSPKTEQEKLEMVDKPYASLVGSLMQVENLELFGYADADLGGCVDSLKSTSGYVFLFGGGAISWKSVKQTHTATSTMQSEYIACYEAASQAIWLKNLITSLRVVDSIERPVQIWNDNSAAVFFTKSNKRSSGTKHLKFKYLSVRENIRDGLVKLDHIGTHFMIADPLTKGLPNGVFHGHVRSMGLVSSFDRED
ncbi:hypothetical protein L3X38_002866 [Prunus dulcis]|uniref:Transposable element protein n=1 Tax=Prunus dulcis TaxID=3755 RepID=A0AAD4ZL27_PRUDU|nr:hypothetical protein L3X38_002866 [Prunus dulcis]